MRITRLVSAFAAAGALATIGTLACDDIIGLHEPSIAKADGGDAAPGPFTAYTSGKRLRAELYVIDGVRALHGWYDSTRREECSFDYYGSPDGTHYCLPTSTQTFGYFADPACTKPAAVYFPAGQPPPKYVTVEPSDACTAQPEVYSLGAAEPASSSYYTLSSGTCSSSTTYGTVYPASQLVPLQSFVRARETVENRGGRIASHAFVADDGAREVVSGYDLQRGEPCMAGPYVSSTPAWTPSHIAWWFPAYGDDRCTKPLATIFGPPTALCPITSVLKPGGDDAGALWRAGPAHAGGQVWKSTSDAACAPYTDSGYEFLEMEDAASAPDTLERSSIVSTGTGRVQLRFDGTVQEGPIAPQGDGQGIPAGPSFVDTKLGAACTMAKTANGTVRCLPSDAFGAKLVFADNVCTQPAIDPAAGPSASLGVVQDPGGSGFTAYEVGQPLPQGYVIDVTDTCVTLGEEAFALGADVTDEFESGADLVE